MGEVYRARDTRLRREVAVKVLPDAVAHNRERLARFQREAGLLAAQYVFSASGQRFLINEFSGRAGQVPITIVTNWTASLKQRRHFCLSTTDLRLCSRGDAYTWARA